SDQIERREKVVGDAVRQLADRVRRRRDDEQHIEARGQRDVLDVRVHAGGELAGDDGVAGGRFEGQRPDESPGRIRHDDTNLVTALLQQARDLNGLIRADASGDPETDESHAPYSVASAATRFTAPLATSSTARRAGFGDPSTFGTQPSSS